MHGGEYFGQILRLIQRNTCKSCEAAQKQACAGHGGFGCSEHAAVGGDKPAGSAEADIAAPPLHRAVSSTGEMRLQRSIVISPQLLQGVRYVSWASRTTWRLWYVVRRLGKVGQPDSLPSLSRVLLCFAAVLVPSCCCSICIPCCKRLFRPHH